MISAAGMWLMQSVVRRPSVRRTCFGASSAALALLIWSCGEGTSEPGANAVCEEGTAKLRGCSLLSEGEVDCRIFENADYASCSIECLRSASCADIEAQACDDVDNAYASCLDRCMLEAFGTVECGDGTRVSIDRACDGEADCNDGADEMGCNDPRPQLECDNGEMVRLEEECDGTSDCSDGSDESGCPERAETVCPGGF